MPIYFGEQVVAPEVHNTMATAAVGDTVAHSGHPCP